MRILVLFTRDLRVGDHPALFHASETASEVVPVFVLDPAILGTSPNRDRFLYECLADLDRSLQRLGGRLIIRRGPVVEQTIDTAIEAECSSIFVTGDVSRYARRRERGLAEAAERAGIGLTVFPENAVVAPGELDRVTAYRVFTPFHRAWSRQPPRPVLDEPRLRVPSDLDPGYLPDPSSVVPEAVDMPSGGEHAGRRRMHAFLGRELRGYGELRDAVATEGTSRLSPYLRFGCVSANELASRARGIPEADGFLRQLAWRDFFLHLFAEDPSLALRDMRPSVGIDEPPVHPDLAVEAWKQGRTGLPLVDAGMRQLLREGWMHNRARLVTASFLTRRLGVAWQVGERHFARLLVDADPANNAGNWQWAAGTGVDPRRARTLNPVLQARRYDPQGEYVRRYVAELAGVGTPAIFAPWLDPALLRETGYPGPIVQVKAEMRRAS